MGKYRLVVALAVTIALFPVLFVFGIGTAVEGDLSYTKIVFPYAVISLLLLRELVVLLGFDIAVVTTAFPEFFNLQFFGIALLQFPVYAMIVGFASSKKLAICISGIAVVHVIFVFVAFVCGYYFEP
jgi:hypothetical protein